MPTNKTKSKAIDEATSNKPDAASSSTPVSVLFVCLGNICRSPMAEAVFTSLTDGDSRIGTIDSAGTGAYHAGDSPDPRTMDTLRNNNIKDYDHDARKVTTSDFTDFDYILAMDENNLEDLEHARNRVLKKDPALESQMGQILLFGDYGGRKGEQVIDPYYGARNGFSVAYEQMTRFTKGFVEQVLEQEEALNQ